MDMLGFAFVPIIVIVGLAVTWVLCWFVGLLCCLVDWVICYC